MKKIVLAIGLWLLAFCLSAQSVQKEAALQEVVVTGTGTQHLLKDAPVQTEVISQTASFAFNENDMGSHLQMNGLGNSYVLILVDGRRLHGDNGGENDLSLIDPHNIEKIEIVKGASSALYGSDAIAGVINIITKKHREQGLMLENTSRVGSYGEASSPAIPISSCNIPTDGRTPARKPCRRPNTTLPIRATRPSIGIQTGNWLNT